MPSSSPAAVAAALTHSSALPVRGRAPRSACRALALLGLCAALLCAGAERAAAQDITAEEQLQLEQLRVQLQRAGQELTPEQEVRLLQRLRAFRSLAATGAPELPGLPVRVRPPESSGAVPGSASALVPTPAAPETPPITEEQLRLKLAALAAPRPLALLEYLPDGVRVDGRRFADSEGRAERFAVDLRTAQAGYAVRGAAGSTIKIARLGAAGEPVAIGRLTQSGSEQVFQSFSGRTLRGPLALTLADGVLVLRDSVAFRYVAGEGVRQIELPAGWSPTPLQRGNVASTGFILLEREPAAREASPLALLGRLGSLVGASPGSFDYALMDMASGRLVPLQVSADGQQVVEMSNCRRRNALVNVCDTARGYSSIWEKNGSRNLSHYFWRIDWQRADAGVVAVAQERELIQVNAIDLATGKRVNLFERALGIGGFDTRLRPDGRLEVVARLALDRGVVDDAAAEIASRPEMPIASGGRPQ